MWNPWGLNIVYRPQQPVTGVALLYFPELMYNIATKIQRRRLLKQGKDLFLLLIYLIICSLFNDTVNNSRLVSNNGATSEY
jgi:hypothetical protein